MDIARQITRIAEELRDASAAAWKSDAAYAETHEEARICTTVAEKIARIGFTRVSARRVRATGDAMYAAALLDKAAADFDLGDDAEISTANGVRLTW